MEILYSHNQKKVARNIGLLYRANHLLNKESLKTIFFAYIHSYLSYANIAETCI